MDFAHSKDRPLTADRETYAESNMTSSVDRETYKLVYNGTETHTDINSRDSSQNVEDFMKRTELMQAERARKN